MTERRTWWWIYAHREDGMPFLISGGATEDQARQAGLEMLGGLDFELHKLHTTNRDAASAELKGKKLKETHNLTQATRRLGHEKSVNRLRQRLSKKLRSRY